MRRRRVLQREGLPRLARELAREHGFYFVGAHPMAGTQYSGYAHSRADLFQDAPLVLVPPAVDDALKLELLGQVREMVRPLGFGNKGRGSPYPPKGTYRAVDTAGYVCFGLSKGLLGFV